MAQGVSDPVIQVAGVVKRYGGVTALAGVGLEVRAGAVTALLGENGAGKSTLVKILTGAEQADEGMVRLRGEPVTFTNVLEAGRAGLVIVFQELSLFPDLDVLANLFPLREPRTRLGLIDRRAMAAAARDVLDSVGLHVDLDAPVGSLTLGEQQLVEVCRALLADADVLVLDEPNSALDAAETDRLMEIIRGLRDRGVAIVCISHRLEEVLAIADDIVVMRNGSVVAAYPREEASLQRIVADTVGDEAARNEVEKPVDVPIGDTVLTLKDMTVGDRVHDVDLTVSEGEVVGLAGLVGSGVDTVFDVAFGACPAGGRVELDGHPAPNGIPASVRAGVAMVPGDRRRAGLALEQSITANIAQVRVGCLGRRGSLLDPRELGRRAVDRCRELDIRLHDVAQPVRGLSGGNQQKVVLAKWLEASPRLVLLQDPTRGVDVGAKQEIYQLIRRLAADGRAVLFASSEFREFVDLCDRVVVMHRGRTCGVLAGADLTEHRLLEAVNTGNLGKPVTTASTHQEHR